MTISLTNYLIFSVLLLFLLYIIVVNVNVKKQRKVTKKPNMKPMKLFDKNNGLTMAAIKKIYKIP